MIKVNIHDAKTNLSKYVHKAEEGETVVLCRRNEPIAEIRKVESRHSVRHRKIGMATELFGEYEIPENFWDPLPKELLDAFEG